MSIQDQLAWQDQAGCRGIKGFTELPELEQRSFCFACPVKNDCFEYSIADGFPIPVDDFDKDHVYGGRNRRERASRRRARQRGRLRQQQEPQRREVAA